MYNFYKILVSCDLFIFVIISLLYHRREAIKKQKKKKKLDSKSKNDA